MSGSAVAWAGERSLGARWSRLSWIAACLVPAIFVLFFLALTFFAAPEHDDYCMASRYLGDGLWHTVVALYDELSGRVVPFALIQLPAAIAWWTGSRLLSAYSLTMAALALVFLAAITIAVARAWPSVRGLPFLSLALGLAGAIIGASPSVRDLLYWLPAVSCYVPPALASILILGECVRALDREGEFSWLSTLGMAAVGLIGALCNEFTGVWLVVIVVSSVIARRAFGQTLQIPHHLLLGGAILMGWLIAVLAKGNSMRMGQFTTAGDILHSLVRGLSFSLTNLEQFLREPVVIGWFLVVAAVTLAEPEPVRPARSREGLLALGVAVIGLGCCYFEYFTHEFSTGTRLVERAQNQALIFLLFGLTLSVSLLVRASRRKFHQRFTSVSGRLKIDSVALPVSLGAVMAVSICLSSTASLLRVEGRSLYPYWRESVERDRVLSTSSEKTVLVYKHRWIPSLLMTADMSVAPGCVAGYYGKTEVKAVDPPTR